MNPARLTRLARELESLAASSRVAEGCARTLRCFEAPTPAQEARLRETLEAVAYDGLAVLHELELLGFAPPAGTELPIDGSPPQRHGRG